MSPRSSVSLSELLLATPAKSLLLAGGPCCLAVAQLVNSYVTGLSPLVAIVFALVMVGFAIIATAHHAAEYRLRMLEGSLTEAPET